MEGLPSRCHRRSRQQAGPAAGGARPRGGRDDQERVEAGPGAQPGSAPGRGRRSGPRRGRASTWSRSAIDRLDEPATALVAADARGPRQRGQVRRRRGPGRGLRRDGARARAGLRPRPRRRLRPGARAGGPARPPGVDHRADGAPRRHRDGSFDAGIAAPRSSSRSRRQRREPGDSQRRDRRRPRDLPQRRPRRARGPGRCPWRRRLGRGGGARDHHRAPRRRPARRPHAGRRRGRGDPHRSPGQPRPSASSRSRSPTRPRT